MKKENNIKIEITPLIDGNCLYVVERSKSKFDFPLHIHPEFELNFIRGAAGARRMVGDSHEEITNKELVLVGSNLEHGWFRHKADMTKKIEEITIQFPASLFANNILSLKLFFSIRSLLTMAQKGVAFTQETIERVSPMIFSIAREPNPFYKFTTFLNLMYELATSENMRPLSYNTFSRSTLSAMPARMKEILDYIDAHHGENISNEKIAAEVSVSTSTLSHFFSKYTGIPLSKYILSVRIQKAAKQLIYTSLSVSEIAYSCGFNNLSYFNRQFRNIERVSPTQFRQIYRSSSDGIID